MINSKPFPSRNGLNDASGAGPKSGDTRIRHDLNGGSLGVEGRVRGEGGGTPLPALVMIEDMNMIPRHENLQPVPHLCTTVELPVPA